MSISSNKFLIAVKMKKYIISSKTLVNNIPKSDYVYRDEYRGVLVRTLENIYYANNDITKTKYLSIIKGNLEIIDFYLELFLKFKYISEKEFEKHAKLLSEIYKMTVSWLKKLEDEKS